ncbi:hypothetical protein OSJ12_19335 [Mycobacterium ulcerans]
MTGDGGNGGSGGTPGSPGGGGTGGALIGQDGLARLAVTGR